MATSQAQYFRSKHGHFPAWTCGKSSISEENMATTQLNPWQVFDKQTWPSHSLNPDNCDNRGTWQTNMATSQLNLDKQTWPPHSLNAGRHSIIQKQAWPLHSLNPGRRSIWQANMANGHLTA